ncbi:1-phosphofructokinase [Cytobacillus oceanisediminis]|jgi:1-phosphofructokinase|uniref:Tagatose-6-phosphate kinase n=2 Tax=Niallia TaxID=2837506 RepID=A0A941GH21_NIACI|nr:MULTISPECIES: 1-phosphofructokinase [Bacillaceae]MDU1845096.1 1-phosphofructokinase [Niallia nealsonii]MBZ9534169.1 1-phosphofructokinase [Cytobacillus oceanisediminis]MCB5238342.1 1-phosphofructokinase [Niallia circulans]MED3793897.1 1-phosphofructokinase [Niallia alba]NMO78010.1 1-phosphofructokinase [Niallia alba]
MIYTLTLNPSVDYIIEVPEVHLGELNRLEKTSKFAGGKGINVSRVLKRMGVQSKALGFVGGFTGSFIENQLQAENIETDFVKVEEDTRINVKVKADTETELNASGPTISEVKFQELKNKIASLTSEDLLVLAGSVPSTLPKTTYEELVKICHENNVSFVVDAEGDLLKAVLPYRPFLIKPNHHELGELFGTTITTAEEAIPYGKKLLEMGAQNVIVSLAGEGAVLISQHEELISTVPKGEVKSSVGAGDSMVAGFLSKYEETQDMKESFRYSIASGSATAFSIGLCTKEKVESLLSQVQLQS